MKGYIYEYYNHVKDMYYIGQTRMYFSRRDWGHRNAKSKNHSWFDNAYTKHPEQFTNKILVTVICPTKKLLVSTLNELEIAFISHYKSIGRKMYNFLNGGNVGWQDTEPTENMRRALDEGREQWNSVQKANKKTSEELKKAHREACKRYELTHYDKYKDNYTKQNKKRAAQKHEWYLKNRERILLKIHNKTQKAQRERELLNSDISLSPP